LEPVPPPPPPPTPPPPSRRLPPHSLNRYPRRHRGCSPLPRFTGFLLSARLPSALLVCVCEGVARGALCHVRCRVLCMLYLLLRRVLWRVLSRNLTASDAAPARDCTCTLVPKVAGAREGARNLACTRGWRSHGRFVAWLCPSGCVRVCVPPVWLRTDPIFGKRCVYCSPPPPSALHPYHRRGGAQEGASGCRGERAG
jgi:hypothetical protein